MNQSEKVTELRKQIRSMDAILARCATPSSSPADLHALYQSAQTFLKDCILLEDGFNKASVPPALPDFAPLEKSIPEEKSQPNDEGNPSSTADSISELKEKVAGVVKNSDTIKKESIPSPSAVPAGDESQHRGAPIKEDKKGNSKPPSGTNQRLADKIHQGQVKNLKKALALHETYRYINELFHGNADMFHSTMQELEQAGSISSASDLLKRIQEQQQWASDHPLLEQLVELIEKRFAE